MVCFIGVTCYYILEFYMIRFFNICVPTEHVPWCAPFSQLSYLCWGFDLILVASNAIDKNGDYVMIELVAMMAIKSFAGTYRLLFVPNYEDKIDIMVKVRDFSIALIIYIGIMCYILGDANNLDIAYILIFFPVTLIAWHTMGSIRRKTVLRRVRNKQGAQQSILAENEYALHALTKLIKEALKPGPSQQQYFGELLDLVYSHLDDCSDPGCVCVEMEHYSELMQLRDMHNQQEVIPLFKDQYIQFRRIIDDQGLIGTISRLSEITIYSRKYNFHHTDTSNMKNQQFNINHNILDGVSSLKNGGISADITEDHQSILIMEDLSIINGNAVMQNIQQDMTTMHLNDKITPNKKHRSNKKKTDKNQNVVEHTYKVNIVETQHRFLSELVYLFFYDIIRRFPESLQIQLIANYFTMVYRRKPLLCVFQLRNFSRGKLSFLDQCAYAINEKYLLHQVEIYTKQYNRNDSSSGSSQIGGGDIGGDIGNNMGSYGNEVNGEYFIKVNQLDNAFNNNVEGLGLKVVSFWRNFLHNQLDVQLSIDTGTYIADHTRKIFELFNKLDEIKCSKDFKIYFQIALVQLHILNDRASYEIYLQKMRSILELNLIFNKNHSSSQGNGGGNNYDISSSSSFVTNENSCFLIVNANGSQFGKVILSNSNVRSLLGQTEEKMKNLTIEELMPDAILSKHNAFVRRFQHTGQSYIINNRAAMFIKKANGYVVPVELFIKFHYSMDYGYTFLAIIQELKEISPFANGQKYQVDQLLFFIVDNDIEGLITEYSDSCRYILKSIGYDFHQETTNITKRIQDIVLDLDFAYLRNTREDRYQSHTIYESTHQLDLSQLIDDSEMGPYSHNILSNMHHDNNRLLPLLQTKQQQMNNPYDTMSMSLQQLDDNIYNKRSNGSRGAVYKAQTRVFEERFSDGILDLNVFCFAIQREYDQQQQQIQLNMIEQSLGMVGRPSIRKSDLRFKVEKSVEKKYGIGNEIDKNNLHHNMAGGYSADEQNQDNSFSHSGSGSSSSVASASATSGLQELKSFKTLTNHQTPKTLSLIVQLIALLYIIMMAVASVNLGINITKQQQSEVDISTVKRSYDRMTSLSNNLVVMRVLVNIANGNEPEQSSMITNRFYRYLDLQKTNIKNFKQILASLENSNQFKATGQLSLMKQTRNVNLVQLTEQNTEYTTDEFLNVAFNMYISKLVFINSQNLDGFKGNISTQVLNGKKAGDPYTPSESEKAVYFITQNSIQSLRRAVIDSSFLYAREAENHANESKTTILLTAIISIISIIAIGMIISPMLTKAETRRYLALEFFLKIPREKLHFLIRNCEYCLQMKDEKAFIQIQRDYEKLLGLKLLSNSEELLSQQKKFQDVNFDDGQQTLRQINYTDIQSLSPIALKDITPSSQVRKYNINRMIDDDESNNQFQSPNSNRQIMINQNNRLSVNQGLNGQDYSFANAQYAFKKEQEVTFQPNQEEKKNTVNSSIVNKEDIILQQLDNNDDLHLNTKVNNDPPGLLRQKSINKSKIQKQIVGVKNIHYIDQTNQKNNTNSKLNNGNNNINKKKILKKDAQQQKYGSSINSQQLQSESGYASSSQKDDKADDKDKDEESEDQDLDEDDPNAVVFLNKQIIRKSVFNRRLSMILSILFTILILSCYFVIAYFLSIDTLNTASEVISKLEIIFSKGQCFDYALSFLKGNQIRNGTIMVRSADEISFTKQFQDYYVGSDYYIDYCMQKEFQYRNLRINTPKFFKYVSDYMKLIETETVCDNLYSSSDNDTLNSICKNGINGIIQQGMSNTFAFMFSYLQKVNMNFDAAGNQGIRTQQFLENQMRDPQMVEIVDYKTKILNPVLDMLNEKSMESVQKYVQVLLLNSLSAYIAFAVVLTFGIVVLLLKGFTRMKKNMLDTNIVLRIIPFDNLQKEDCEDIKNFFKQ